MADLFGVDVRTIKLSSLDRFNESSELTKEAKLSEKLG